jgi:hypothetical protein
MLNLSPSMADKNFLVGYRPLQITMHVLRLGKERRGLNEKLALLQV